MDEARAFWDSVLCTTTSATHERRARPVIVSMAINVNRAQEAADLVSNKRKKHAAQVTYLQSNASGSTGKMGHHDAFASHYNQSTNKQTREKVDDENGHFTLFLSFICLIVFPFLSVVPQ